MATPELGAGLQINLTNPTEASIAVSGKVLGTIKIELKEIETIEGIINPIVLVGECLNSQNGEKLGFVFQALTNLITAQDVAVEPTQEPTEPTTEGN